MQEKNYYFYKERKMELDEYKNIVRERYMALTDEEKTIAESMSDSPVGVVLGKLFGPEMGDTLMDDSAPIDETTVAIPTDMTRDMPSEMPTETVV